ncbi:MAG: transcriptional regulator [Methanobacteriaceae archaeon]|nr:transcriptional regulator [Methanobacteriaceae archaeon]
MPLGNTTIKKEHILKDINQLLLDYGFKTSDIYDRNCFDIVARKDDVLVVLKILVNIDSLSSIQSEEIRKLAGIFRAAPIIIGLKHKTNYLEEDVVYERYDIPAISPQTFCNVVVNEAHPEIYARRGGYYVQIDGNLLKQLREEKNLSLKKLADISHVSRETIYKYEQGISLTYPETAILLENILDKPIVKTINIYSQRNEDFINDLIKEPEELIKLGFEISSAKKTPFDAITQSDNEDIQELEKLKKKLADGLDEVKSLQEKIMKKSSKDLLLTNLDKNRDNKTLNKMSLKLEDIANITENDALFVLEHEKDETIINNVPIIYKWELKEMDSSKDVLKLIKERKSEKS